MNEFFKSIMGKCFLHTLLCTCIFLTLILLGCFIAGNTNVFEWAEIGRFLVTLISVAVTVGVISYKEII
jgi:hypothetical protein